MIYNIENKNSLDIAASFINDGNIIIYPTDTLYGFGVDATNSNAINKLNKLKKRKQVYSIVVSSIDMLKRYAEVDFIQEKKMNKYFPGAYTLIFKKKKSNLSHLITLDLETVGIRIPNHSFPCDLVQLINKPIVTTSVNIHGTKPLTDSKIMIKQFPKINIFKDIETSSLLKGSTIIDFTTSDFKILRG